jgi:hypothetical protein
MVGSSAFTRRPPSAGHFRLPETPHECGTPNESLPPSPMEVPSEFSNGLPEELMCHP